MIAVTYRASDLECPPTSSPTPSSIGFQVISLGCQACSPPRPDGRRSGRAQVPAPDWAGCPELQARLAGCGLTGTYETRLSVRPVPGSRTQPGQACARQRGCAPAAPTQPPHCSNPAPTQQQLALTPPARCSLGPGGAGWEGGQGGAGLAGWEMGGRWAGMGRLVGTFVQPERTYMCAE